MAEVNRTLNIDITLFPFLLTVVFADEFYNARRNEGLSQKFNNSIKSFRESNMMTSTEKYFSQIL